MARMNLSGAASLATLIFLYGAPGSGKSTIGQLLADNLALPFVDLDLKIEEHVGMSIPEIFEVEGESRFRQLEREQLKDITNQEWGVIALGGGSLLDPANRASVEAAGPIICLMASCEELLDRLTSTSIERPLLVEGKGGGPAGPRLVELLERLARREDVTVVLVTHDRRILDVADCILTLEDGRLSSLLSSVTADTRRMVGTLARDIRKGELARRLVTCEHVDLGARVQMPHELQHEVR